MVRPVDSPDEKSRVCGLILHALPQWFGVEQSIVDYCASVADLPFFVAYDENEMAIGFIALKLHNEYTAEVYVMGVREKYQRAGIGRQLIATCEQYCLAQGMEYLTVKTLDVSRESRRYARTRAFYLALGFRPLEVFPLYWDADNPCVFMAKRLPQ